MPTGQDAIFSGITVEEHRFVPCSRHLFQEIEGQAGRVGQVVRRDGEILNRVLEQNGRGELEDVGRPARRPAIVRAVVAFVEECPAELHAAHGVANEGMEAGVEGLEVVEMLVEHEVFGGEHRFAADIVGVHPLPAAREGATVEDNHQAVVVGIAEDGFVEAHGLLFVSAKEIHLDTLHADFFQPFHFLFTHDGIVHAVRRALYDVVPIAAGAVPEEDIDVFRVSIIHQLLHPFVADIRIPPVVNQDILEIHRSSQVDVAHLVVVVDARVLPDNPAPRSFAIFIGMLGGKTGRYDIPGDGCLYNRLQIVPDGDGTPRSRARQGETRGDRPVAVVFLRHREGDGEKTVRRGIAQARGAVAGIHTGLADQSPAVVADSE